MYARFAFRYFAARKSANAINIISRVTVTVIAFATCCQVLVLSTFNGFEGLVKSLYSSFYSDLKVVPAHGKSFTISEAQLSAIRAISGVSALSRSVEEKAVLQNEDAQTVISLRGVDGEFAKVSGVADHITQGDFSTGSADSPRLVVGYGIQNVAGINTSAALPASDVTLILPRRSETINPEEAMSEGNVKAAGVFSIQQEIDNSYAFTDLDFVKAQLGFAGNEYSSLEIAEKKNSDETKLIQSLQQLLGPNFTVQNRYQQNANLYSTMALEKWAIYAVLTLILIIAAFNMVSALTMLVLEKRKDISILRSMGETENGILKIFLAEGLLLGIAGTVIGILLAVIISVLQIKFHLIKLSGGSFLIDYFPVRLLPADFLLVACIAIFISFLAAWFPAKKAAGRTLSLR